SGLPARPESEVHVASSILQFYLQSECIGGADIFNRVSYSNDVCVGNESFLELALDRRAILRDDPHFGITHDVVDVPAVGMHRQSLPRSDSYLRHFDPLVVEKRLGFCYLWLFTLASEAGRIWLGKKPESQTA